MTYPYAWVWLQAGGRAARQDVYHELHLVERSLRRFAPPAPALVSPGEAPPSQTAASLSPSAATLAVVGPHLQWAAPFVLQVRPGCRPPQPTCCHWPHPMQVLCHPYVRLSLRQFLVSYPELQ